MSENGQRRVVITGLGMVSPLGNTVEDSWAALVAGESGAGEITQFDTTGFPVDFACEVKNLEVTDYVDYKASRRMDRFTHLALAAARQAESDAGLDIASEAERVGAAVATGIGGLKSFEACIQVLDSRGPDRVNPFSIVQIIPNLAAGWVSMELGTKGPLLSECTACAASNMAIGDGLDEHSGHAAVRHDLRRHGGAGVPGRDRRLRRDARHLPSERRPEGGVAPVRCRARRLRDGRGERDVRPRGA